MNRFIVLIALPVLLFSPAALSQNAKAKRPNIVLIIADDLGYGDLSCYGQRRYLTPNIDKLAIDGMRFTQFYSGSTVCAPARASLMTGLHTGHTPVRGNRAMEPEGQFPLPESTVTIASILQKNGYTTGAFGKWGLGPPASSGEPLNKGFNTFYGYICQSLAHNYYPAYVWNDRRKEQFANIEEKHTVYSADTIHKKAMQFLQQQTASKPFFLFLPYTIPHGDVMVPHDEIYQSFRLRFNDEDSVPRPAAKAANRAHESYPHAGFASMVTRLDRYVGEIVAALKKQGLAENTLVLFTSDNGPHRENGGDPEYFDGNGRFRGIKRDLYEGGIRVPLIAYWPGKIKAGKLNDQALILYDLFPTFQQVAGMPVSKNIDGISMLPALRGRKQKQHEYLYWEFHEQGGKQAVRIGKFKGVRLNISTLADGPVELYNIGEDPGEQKNIAADYPEVVKRMAQIMKKAHVPDVNWPVLVSEKNN